MRKYLFISILFVASLGISQKYLTYKYFPGTLDKSTGQIIPVKGNIIHDINHYWQISLSGSSSGMIKVYDVYQNLLEVYYIYESKSVGPSTKAYTCYSQGENRSSSPTLIRIDLKNKVVETEYSENNIRKIDRYTGLISTGY